MMFPTESVLILSNRIGTELYFTSNMNMSDKHWRQKSNSGFVYMYEIHCV